MIKMFCVRVIGLLYFAFVLLLIVLAMEQNVGM